MRKMLIFFLFPASVFPVFSEGRPARLYVNSIKGPLENYDGFQLPGYDRGAFDVYLYEITVVEISSPHHECRTHLVIIDIMDEDDIPFPYEVETEYSVSLIYSFSLSVPSDYLIADWNHVILPDDKVESPDE